MARREISPIHVKLNTHFQTVAVSVKLHKRITLCSLYVPPGAQYDFTQRELEALLKQLPKPYMLLGDPNAHNGIWFDKGNVDARGTVIENVLINNDLCVG